MNYGEIVCPKCGKSHFSVKLNSSSNFFSLLVFHVPANLIYKDGILQNPEAIEPQKERYQCLECGCNFRSEVRPAIGETASVPVIIDEDEEERKAEEEYKKHMEEFKKKFPPDDTVHTQQETHHTPSNEETQPTLADHDGDSILYTQNKTEVEIYDVITKVENLEERVAKLEGEK